MSSNPETTPGGLRLRAHNEEVLYADAPLSTLGRPDIDWLVAKAMKTARQRIRICSHRDSGDLLHEMMIIHTRDTYVRPHRHVNKDESFHVVSGEVDVVLFEENGAVSRAIRMGDYATGKQFYYRLNESRYHTLLIRSPVLVFHEVTTGPFRREETIFAPWGPEETQMDQRKEFLARVERDAARMLA